MESTQGSHAHESKTGLKGCTGVALESSGLRESWNLYYISVKFPGRNLGRPLHLQFNVVVKCITI